MGKRGKTTMGRQRIEMKKIENEDARQVSFSKRRMGLFKKASELSTLCGAELAVVVFSPAGKVFSIGQPSVDLVIDRFLSNDSGLRGRWPSPSERFQSAVVRGLNRQCMDLMIHLEREKDKRVVLEERVSELTRDESYPWAGDMEGLGLGKVEKLLRLMGELKIKVDAKVHELVHGASSSNSTRGVNPVGIVNPFEAIASSSIPVQEVNQANPFGTMASSSNPTQAVNPLSMVNPFAGRGT